MASLILFMEGLLTFLSPCLLPMLPLYLLYFAGGKKEEGLRSTLKNALAFVLGFTVVFLLMGAFAASLGRALQQHQRVVNLVTGLVVVFLGLHFMGVLKVGLLDQNRRLQSNVRPVGFFSTVLFGMVFSLGWTPCVGAFLGSALMLASQQGSVIQGVGMLLVYSLGLGVPFVLSALLLDQLKGAFQWIKDHYRGFQLVCGGLLVVMGVLMMTGLMNRLLSWLS